MESSTTQKGKKRKTKDTSMSTTIATTVVPPADVLSSEDSELSDADIDTMCASVLPTQKNTGISGLNISLRRPEGCYTWKSPEWTSADRYYEIKIYDNPNKLKSVKPMDMWKQAAFSAKMLLPNKGKNGLISAKINKKLDQIMKMSLQLAQQYPSVDSNLVEAYDKKD